MREVADFMNFPNPLACRYEKTPDVTSAGVRPRHLTNANRDADGERALVQSFRRLVNSPGGFESTHRMLAFTDDRITISGNFLKFFEKLLDFENGVPKMSFLIFF